ncbi:GSCOCG00007537001-RA-CDS [Cotesia congregata]|nr:GSCOCG00007537001-RA-CDS [Cotesia congregata]
MRGPMALLTSLPPCAKLPKAAVRTWRKENNFATSGLSSISVPPVVSNRGLALLFPLRPGCSPDFTTLLVMFGVSVITDKGVVSFLLSQAPKLVGTIRPDSKPATTAATPLTHLGKPRSRGILAFNIDFFINQNNNTDTIPLSIGLANHDPAIFNKAIHLTY